MQQNVRVRRCSKAGLNLSDGVRGETAGRPRLGIESWPNVQLLETPWDIDAHLPPVRRPTSRKQKMETASENIPHISWLNTCEVREWGRLPSEHMHSGGVAREILGTNHKASPRLNRDICLRQISSKFGRKRYHDPPFVYLPFPT